MFKIQPLKELIAPFLPELGEKFSTTDVLQRICTAETFDRLRDQDFTVLKQALAQLGYSQTFIGDAVIQGRKTMAMLWQRTPQDRLCTWHERFEPCEVCKAQSDEREAYAAKLEAERVEYEARRKVLEEERKAHRTAREVESETERKPLEEECRERTKRLDDAIAQLEAALADAEDEEEEDDPGPHSRGVVVLDRRLEALQLPLQSRNMIVLVAPTDDIDDESRRWLLSHRVVIVEDEAPLVDDASSYEYGIVSCGLLSNREPKRMAKIVSDVFVHSPKLWHQRHGWKLVLRDDGEHEYAPLVD